MNKELDKMSDETKYELNVYCRQLSKDLTNLMDCLRKQDKDNKAILYEGRHLKKVILPYEEYQKMCQRLEQIDNAKSSEALKKLDDISYLVLNEIDDLKNKELWKSYFNTIKATLLKAQEQHKVLDIIKEKNVDIKLLKCSTSWLDYYTRFKHKTGYDTELTEEEFKLLKRWLG